MLITVDPQRRLHGSSRLLFGHFLEHFHRQVYGGVYDPGSPFSDADGLRKDVVQALRDVGVPVIRWPGGCFVSAYHWQDGVGAARRPSFNKAWRVEESNAFGTDEFIALCRKAGCAPYICTNAGTGTAEEMSDWVEYCNLPGEGLSRLRIQNGHAQPYNVKYWSIGNENYGAWEMGAKDAGEWSRLVTESAKMMRRVDPTIELSAAALPDISWNVALLSSGAARHLKWLSIHRYWDPSCDVNASSGYEACMAYTGDLAREINQVRGMLTAFGLEKQIKIAFDEWNLRGWYHPGVMGDIDPDRDRCVSARDQNDDNSAYTMADAVFSACFLNALLRNADIVGMANFSPFINTRGALYVHAGGLVRRATYYVFAMYQRLAGGDVIDLYDSAPEAYAVTDRLGAPAEVARLDAVAVRHAADGAVVIALVNKDAARAAAVDIRLAGNHARTRMTTLCGDAPEAYNDIDGERARPFDSTPAAQTICGGLRVTLPPHSVNVLELLPT